VKNSTLKSIKEYLIVSLKATATGIISVITVGLISMFIVAVVGYQLTAPILTGAVPFIAPEILDTIWNISLIGASLAAILSVFLVSLPMYIFVWGFYGQNIFGFVKGQKGLLGYLNVGIRDLIATGISYVFFLLAATVITVTGGLATPIGILFHFFIYGFILVNVMGFKK